jgi:hypothetical protein
MLGGRLVVMEKEGGSAGSGEQKRKEAELHFSFSIFHFSQVISPAYCTFTSRLALYNPFLLSYSLVYYITHPFDSLTHSLTHSLTPDCTPHSLLHARFFSVLVTHSQRSE